MEVWIHPSSKGKEVMRSAQRWQLVTAKGKVYGSCEIGVLVLAVSRGFSRKKRKYFRSKLAAIGLRLLAFEGD